MKKISAQTLYWNLVGRQIWHPLAYITDEGMAIEFNELPQDSFRSIAAKTTSEIARIMGLRPRVW